MKCPGQDSRYWKPGAIFESECPGCGQSVEFFKDDTARKCPTCGHRFVNPSMDFGCAAYCQFAEQCLGSLPPEVAAEQEELLKDKVAIQMRRHLGSDHKRIAHANRVAAYAEKLGKQERADMAVVLIAAYLQDIGLSEDEAEGPGQAGGSHQQAGARTARSLLQGLGAKQELIDEVAAIIEEQHRPEAAGSLSSKVVSDANHLVTLEDSLQGSPLSPQELEERIEASFSTRSGREQARQSLTPLISSSV